ncbi:MAG: alpha/beta hydrolase [Nitriliruptoraceae bacterium]
MWRESFVQAGATRFFVRTYGVAGDAPYDRAGDEHEPPGDDLAVLLHGWPQDGSSWRWVAPRLAAAGYRVVCPDLKGFGRSDAPRRGYDPATLADEIAQLIQALHARKALLVGHDWGGAVALATAFRHPGRVAALVVASSPFRQLDLTVSWHVPLLNIPLAPQLAFRVAGRPLTRAVIHYATVVHEPFDDDALDRYADAVMASPTGWLAYYRTLSRRAVLDWGVRKVRRRVPFLAEPPQPHRLRVPAVVIWGEEDRVTPFHLAARVAHDLEAGLVALPGVGHMVHEEAPEAFTTAVLDLVAADPAEPEPLSDAAGEA